MKKGIGSEARAERLANADVDLQLLGEAERDRQLQKQKRRRRHGHEDDVCHKFIMFLSFVIYDLPILFFCAFIANSSFAFSNSLRYLK